MSVFILNIVLSIVWNMLNGHFSFSNLFVGFIIGFCLIALLRQNASAVSYVRKTILVIRFFSFLLWEIFVSNFKVAADVISPKEHNRPGVIAIPLDCKTDLEITFFANTISLTPGTLTLDISDDRKVLYIHAMFIRDIDALRQEIKNKFERPILEILR